MAYVRSENTAIEPAISLYEAYGKRMIDLILAVALLPILAPVIALLWVLAKRDGGSGFFGNVRVGQDGKIFKCWKIRSMITDPDPVLNAYLTENEEEAENWRVYRKLDNDPRVTRLGRFVRATSLDELPQIWNVLRGDMSLVGPRPILRDEVEMYGPTLAVYKSMRPGITGLWQVSGRNDLSFAERVKMDVEYCENMSMKSDMGLIFRTGLSILAKTGR